MVHQVSVNSTLRLNDRGEKKRPTIDWWAYSALKHHLCDDGALTYGQVGSEAILFDLAADYEVDGDRLSAIEEQVLDDLDAHLGMDTRTELASLGEQYELEVEGRLAKHVHDRDDVDESPYSRKSQVSMYFIDCNLPEGRLGRKIEDSLTRLLASPWDSRVHRLNDLQALLTAVTRGWDAVDRDSRFLNWVRSKDASVYELGELAEAVSTAVDGGPDASSSESQSTTVTATDGGSDEWWESEDVTLDDLRERDATEITEGAKHRVPVIEKAIRNSDRPVSESDLYDLVTDIYGVSDSTADSYVNQIDLRASPDEDGDEAIPVRDIIEDELRDAKDAAEDEVETANPYSIEATHSAGLGLRAPLDEVLEGDIVHSEDGAMAQVRRVQKALYDEGESDFDIDSEWSNAVVPRARDALTSAKARILINY